MEKNRSGEERNSNETLDLQLKKSKKSRVVWILTGVLVLIIVLGIVFTLNKIWSVLHTNGSIDCGSPVIFESGSARRITSC